MRAPLKCKCSVLNQTLLPAEPQTSVCLLIKRWYGLSVGLTRSLSIYISPSLPRPQLLKLPWQLLLPLFLSSTLCLLLPGRHQFHRCVPLLSIQQRLWCSWLVHPILHIVTNSLRMRSEIRAHYIGFGTKVPLLFNQVILHDQFRFTHVFFFFSSSYKPAGLPKSALMTIVFRPTQDATLSPTNPDQSWSLPNLQPSPPSCAFLLSISHHGIDLHCTYGAEISN